MSSAIDDGAGQWKRNSRTVESFFRRDQHDVATETVNALEGTLRIDAERESLAVAANFMTRRLSTASASSGLL